MVARSLFLLRTFHMDFTVFQAPCLPGDGLALSEEESPEVKVRKDAHFLFFDLPG